MVDGVNKALTDTTLSSKGHEALFLRDERVATERTQKKKKTWEDVSFFGCEMMELRMCRSIGPRDRKRGLRDALIIHLPSWNSLGAKAQT
jgi:hypothetical protein